MNFSLNMIWISSSVTNLFIVSRISLTSIADDRESNAYHREAQESYFLEITAGKHHGIPRVD